MKIMADQKTIEAIVSSSPTLQRVRDREEVLWINPAVRGLPDLTAEGLSVDSIDDAEQRLLRFAPYIMAAFPETTATGGLIESPLVEIPAMAQWLKDNIGEVRGRLFLKEDSHLAIAGSIKARGGIYEILKHSEDLAREQGLLSAGESYAKLAAPQSREFFSGYSIHVGSTGNLGLSIGIISAKLGYQVTVHMSSDARQWKKDLLRHHGATVREYAGDYEAAVAAGRKLAEADPKSYFVDDENSRTLFFGYAVAARRLARQLADQGIAVDEAHPLLVYIPCGVGGAPGGIAWGLKAVFGAHVHTFFIEPVETPCMLVGMASGLNQEISVQDIGLSGQTEADGLAVARPSGFVGLVMKEILSGIFTLNDDKLYRYLQALYTTEGIFIEPSAAAAFEGPGRLMVHAAGENYLRGTGVFDHLDGATHIAWATGGNLVPEAVRQDYLNR